MIFESGDKVKFVNNQGTILNSHNTIPHFYYGSDIGEKNTIHGTTEIGKKYDTEFATVITIVGEFVVVKYMGSRGKYTQLGFLEESLVLCKVKSWKDII